MNQDDKLKQSEEPKREHQAEMKFMADVMALWTPELEKKYPTLGQLMESAEGIELRKRYWPEEAGKRGEL
jgi:hypothetical protein